MLKLNIRTPQVQFKWAFFGVTAGTEPLFEGTVNVSCGTNDHKDTK